MEYKPQFFLSNKDKSYLSVARYLAKKSKAKKKHGAIVVKANRVLGMGFNKDKNHPLSISQEHIKDHASIHAEVDAIKDAGWNVKGATLYVARINNLGQDRNSRPCPRCTIIIEEAEIKRVIYTESINNVRF